jgi:hypothetical protein
VPILAVLVNDQGDVVGTAQTEARGQGTDVPGGVSLVARPGQWVMEITVDEETLNLGPSALHEFIKTKYLPPAVTSEDESMPPKDPRSAEKGRNPHGKPSSPSEEERDLVITPGGPKPRGSVHQVRQNEVVRRNPDATYTVVPKDRSLKSGSERSRKRSKASKRKSR